MKPLFLVLGLSLFIASPSVLAALPSATVQVSVVPSLSQSIPLGATRVPMVSLVFQTPCSADIALSSVTLHHKGLGSLKDIEAVSGWIGSKRVTRSSSINHDSEVTLRFLSLSLPRCAKTTIDILAGFSQSASPSGVHSLVLRSAEDIDVAGVPVTLEQAKPSSVTTVPSDTIATIDVAMLPLTTSVSYGPQRGVARLQLRSGGTRDQAITSITFTNKGSAANSDLQQLALYSSTGEQLTASVSRMEGKTVTLAFSKPLLLSSHQTIVLQLRGDVTASRRKTIQFAVEEPSDIAVGPVQR